MRIWDTELLLAKASEPSYITDGLVLWLDGIQNTRSGHNASATTWEDLSGNQYYFTASSTPVWADDHCVFNGSFHFVKDTPNNELSNTGTVEVCFKSSNNVCVFSFNYGAMVVINNGKLRLGSYGGSGRQNCGEYVKPSNFMSVSFKREEYPTSCMINGASNSSTGTGWFGEGSGHVARLGNRNDGNYWFQTAFDS